MAVKKATRRHERRERTRVDARLSMRVEGAADGAHAQIVTESQNISSSGVYCMSSHFLPPLSKVQLTIVLPKIPGTKRAQPEDFGHEFLDMIIAAKLVDGVDQAIAHIRKYGSNHTESILTENDATAERFFTQLDSAILMRNASTQFADGGEFGMGAEIGIATGKLHARGPVGAEQLCSFKYLVTGDGTIRS